MLAERNSWWECYRRTNQLQCVLTAQSLNARAILLLHNPAAQPGEYQSIGQNRLFWQSRRVTFAVALFSGGCTSFPSGGCTGSGIGFRPFQYGC